MPNLYLDEVRAGGEGHRWVSSVPLGGPVHLASATWGGGTPTHPTLRPRGPDGLTLREKLTQDHIDHSSGRKKILYGAGYYATLRDIYRAPSNAASLLSGPSPPLPVDDRLINAMTAAKKQHPDRGLIVNYMKISTSMPNATEVVGMFRFCLTLRCGCSRQLLVAMEALRYIARLKLKAAYPEAFGVLRSWIDSVLTSALDRARRQRTPDADFMALHRPCAGLLLDEAALTAVLSAPAYTSVTTQLAMLVSSYDFGARLYLGPFESVISSAVTTKINDSAMTAFNKLKNIDEPELLQIQSEVALVVEGMDGVQFLAPKHEVKVMYRGSRSP